MSNGIKTLEAADNALTSITSTVQSMQSTLRQARQDKSFKTESYSVNLAATPAGTEQISIHRRRGWRDGCQRRPDLWRTDRGHLHCRQPLRRWTSPQHRPQQPVARRRSPLVAGGSLDAADHRVDFAVDRRRRGAEHFDFTS